MNKRAFTLMEVMIALTVVILVMSSVLSFLISSMDLNELNQKYFIAMNIAQAKMAEKINQRPNFDSIGPDPAILLYAGSDGIDGICRVDVTTLVLPPVKQEYKILDVYVCWKSRRGRVIGSCHDTNSDGRLDAWYIPPESPAHIRAGITKVQ